VAHRMAQVIVANRVGLPGVYIVAGAFTLRVTPAAAPVILDISMANRASD